MKVVESPFLYDEEKFKTEIGRVYLETSTTFSEFQESFLQSCEIPYDKDNLNEAVASLFTKKYENILGDIQFLYIFPLLAANSIQVVGKKILNNEDYVKTLHINHFGTDLKNIISIESLKYSTSFINEMADDVVHNNKNLKEILSVSALDNAQKFLSTLADNISKLNQLPINSSEKEYDEKINSLYKMNEMSNEEKERISNLYRGKVLRNYLSGDGYYTLADLELVLFKLSKLYF